MIHKSNDPYGCDWALLALEGQTMDLSSYNLNIKTQAMYDGNKEFVLRSVASTAPTGHVCIVTRRGIVKATGSGSSTIINLGSSLRGRVAWTLEVDSHIGKKTLVTNIYLLTTFQYRTWGLWFSRHRSEDRSHVWNARCYFSNLGRSVSYSDG